MPTFFTKSLTLSANFENSEWVELAFYISNSGSKVAPWSRARKIDSCINTNFCCCCYDVVCSSQQQLQLKYLSCFLKSWPCLLHRVFYDMDHEYAGSCFSRVGRKKWPARWCVTFCKSRTCQTFSQQFLWMKLLCFKVGSVSYIVCECTSM